MHMLKKHTLIESRIHFRRQDLNNVNNLTLRDTLCRYWPRFTANWLTFQSGLIRLGLLANSVKDSSKGCVKTSNFLHGQHKLGVSTTLPVDLMVHSLNPVQGVAAALGLTSTAAEWRTRPAAPRRLVGTFRIRAWPPWCLRALCTPIWPSEALQGPIAFTTRKKINVTANGFSYYKIWIWHLLLSFVSEFHMSFTQRRGKNNRKRMRIHVCGMFFKHHNKNAVD